MEPQRSAPIPPLRAAHEHLARLAACIGAPPELQAERLRETVAELRYALAELEAAGLERDRQLEAVRKRAEQLDREGREKAGRKEEFLAMLAHELRNPLSAIRNALHILRFADAPGSMADQAWLILGRQVEHLSRLLEDLLEASRLTHGRIVLRKERVDLAEVVRRVLATVQPSLDARRHSLEVSLPEKPLLLVADTLRLEQVLTNLLDNAARYTEPGGRISVTARREGNEVVLRVQDNGGGISPDLLPRVFDLFAQAERALDRSQGGLGIGLALVRRLVELHGGRVCAQSEGPGKGSEFTVYLPAADPTPAN